MNGQTVRGVALGFVVCLLGMSASSLANNVQHQFHDDWCEDPATGHRYPPPPEDGCPEEVEVIQPEDQQIVIPIAEEDGLEHPEAILFMGDGESVLTVRDDASGEWVPVVEGLTDLTGTNPQFAMLDFDNDGNLDAVIHDNVSDELLLFKGVDDLGGSTLTSADDTMSVSAGIELDAREDGGKAVLEVNDGGVVTDHSGDTF